MKMFLINSLSRNYNYLIRKRNEFITLDGFKRIPATPALKLPTLLIENSGTAESEPCMCWHRYC